jgi:hypothetical protein
MNMRLSRATVCVTLAFIIPAFVYAQQPSKTEAAVPVTLFQNVRVWTYADPRPDRRALACDADTAQSYSGDHR